MSAEHISFKKKCVDICNNLIFLKKLEIPPVHAVNDITSDVIILLFENIVQQTIPDLIIAQSKEDEAHNLQAVIDFLSLDLLGISLSHITGEDIIKGKIVSLLHLLEILEGVSTYLHISDFNLQKKQGSTLKRKVCKKRRNESSSLNQSSCDNKGQSRLERNLKFQYPSLKTKLFNRKNSLKKTESIASPPSKVARIHKTVFGNGHFSKETFHKTPDSFCHGMQELTKIANTDENKSTKYQQSSGPERNPILSDKKYKPTRILLKSQRSQTSMKSKPEEIEELLEDNLEQKLRVILEKDGSYKPRATRLKRLQLQSIYKPSRKNPVKACKKSFLLPHPLRNKTATQAASKRISSSGFKHLKEHNMNRNPSFVQELFDEFPSIELSPGLLNHISKKYLYHLSTMHKKLKDSFLQKPKIQKQAEAAAQKQSSFSKILKKDIEQQIYMREFKDHKKFENQIKFQLRDARLQSAKMKQYCDEFHSQLQKKMQKRNYAEELIFENTFKDAINIQKEQVDLLCKELKEANENDAKQHLVYLDALENLYQSQYAMLCESLQLEQKIAEEKATADKEAMDVMERTFRDELKNEIRFMQTVIVDCLGDTHFRELDAENYKSKLRKKTIV